MTAMSIVARADARHVATITASKSIAAPAEEERRAGFTKMM
jgi:hypothetical protein